MAADDYLALDQRIAELEQRVQRLEGQTPPADTGPGLLTARQRRIAALVATGLTNAETAAALALSPKTIEWNLSRIYRALGVRSRTELTHRLGSSAARPGPDGPRTAAARPQSSQRRLR